MISSTNPALPDKTKEEELQERREKVNEFLAQGWTEKRIANELGVSIPTIVRDVKYLKDQAFDWVDDLARTDFIFEVRKSVGELENLKTRLYGYLDDNKLDISTKVKISRELREILNLKLDTLGSGPTLQGMKRMVNQFGSGPQTQPYNFNNNV